MEVTNWQQPTSDSSKPGPSWVAIHYRNSQWLLSSWPTGLLLGCLRTSSRGNQPLCSSVKWRTGAWNSNTSWVVRGS
jgi:hypothetical protein